MLLRIHDDFVKNVINAMIEATSDKFDRKEVLVWINMMESDKTQQEFQLKIRYA